MCKKQETLEELHKNDAKLWDEGWIDLQIAPHGKLATLHFIKIFQGSNPSVRPWTNILIQNDWHYFWV